MCFAVGVKEGVVVARSSTSIGGLAGLLARLVASRLTVRQHCDGSVTSSAHALPRLRDTISSIHSHPSHTSFHNALCIGPKHSSMQPAASSLII